MPAVTAHQRGAVFVLIGTILLWGYSWIVMKQVMAHAGPFDFAALLLSGHSLRPPPVLPMVLIGLCQTAAFQGLEQWALVSGGAGHVAMLAFTGQSAEHRPRHRRRPRLGGGHGAEQAHVSTPRALSAQSHRLANAGRWHRAGDRGAGGAATFDRLELGLHRRPCLQRGAGLQPGVVAVVDRIAAIAYHSGQRFEHGCPDCQRAAGVADPARATIGDGAGWHRTRATGTDRGQRGAVRQCAQALKKGIPNRVGERQDLHHIQRFSRHLSSL